RTGSPAGSTTSRTGSPARCRTRRSPGSTRACPGDCSGTRGLRGRNPMTLAAPLVLLPFLAAAPPDAPNPPGVRHVTVYAERGRFGGWPANHGLWAWGDEILVGFSAGYSKDNGPGRHAIDHDRPEEHLLARSRDGGQSWAIENPSAKGALIPVGKALHGV